jgi:predicted small metal-binding protein
MPGVSKCLTRAVLQACASHGKEAHGMDAIPPELAEKVPAAIHDE